MSKRSSIGATKVIIGLITIIAGLFVTLFSGISYMFRSFGGVTDLGLLIAGLIFLFVGMWMVLDASFSDVEVRISNLDELASLMGKSVQRCQKCATPNPANAEFCMKCGSSMA